MIDIEIILSAWNTVLLSVKKWTRACLNSYQQIICLQIILTLYIYIYIYIERERREREREREKEKEKERESLGLNNWEGLICYKTQPIS